MSDSKRKVERRGVGTYERDNRGVSLRQQAGGIDYTMAAILCRTTVVPMRTETPGCPLNLKSKARAVGIRIIGWPQLSSTRVPVCWFRWLPPKIDADSREGWRRRLKATEPCRKASQRWGGKGWQWLILCDRHKGEQTGVSESQTKQ